MFLPLFFHLQGERIFQVNICVFVCDCYLKLIILFRTKQCRLQYWVPYCVGPAHMHCQSSFMSLVLRVFKFSFQFIEKWPNAWECLTSLNEKWCKAEQACLTRWRKRKERSKGHSALCGSWSKNREPFSHFGVSSRESKTQVRASAWGGAVRVKK